MQLVGRAAVVLEVAGAGRDVGAGLLDGLAGVAAFQLGQGLMLLQDQGREAAQHAAALGGCGPAPGAVEGAARGRHRGVHIARIAARQPGEDLAIGGVQHLQREAAGRGARLAIDEIQERGQCAHQGFSLPHCGPMTGATAGAANTRSRSARLIQGT